MKPVPLRGHQASSASLATIMTALYFRLRRLQNRVAIKPQASPIFMHSLADSNRWRTNCRGTDDL